MSPQPSSSSASPAPHAGAITDVAGIMAALFLSSAVQILRQAWAEYRSAGSAVPAPAE